MIDMESELEVIDTSNVLTKEELKLVKEIISAYRAGKIIKWLFVLMLSVGAASIPIISWIQDHVAIK